MDVILLVAVGTIVFVSLIAIYQKSTNAICKSQRRLDNKTAIVTGGTAGMGLSIATDFAKRGARVIVCCPFPEEGQRGLETIVKESGNKNVVFKLMDLGSLASVRKFAQEILSEEDRLDILVNNAGVSCPPDYLTPDGLNRIMQINYFGHFLLTLLLLPLLRKSAPSRIITTSSVTHRLIKLKMERLNSVNHGWITRNFIYGKSKFCLVPMAFELTRRLKGTGVVINCVDPGAVGTNIFINVYGMGTILRFLSNYVYKTPLEGAQTAIFASVDESVENVSGKYFQNCARFWASPLAYNKKLAKQLFEESARLVKLSDDELEKAFAK